MSPESKTCRCLTPTYTSTGSSDTCVVKWSMRPKEQDHKSNKEFDVKSEILNLDQHTKLAELDPGLLSKAGTVELWGGHIIPGQI